MAPGGGKLSRGQFAVSRLAGLLKIFRNQMVLSAQWFANRAASRDVHLQDDASRSREQRILRISAYSRFV